MAKIVIELDKCIDSKRGIECPFATSRLTKGYGYAVDYLCGLNNNEITSRYVEWERDIKPIPDWCPILLKEKKK